MDMDIEIPNIFPRSAFFALILIIFLFSSKAWSDYAQMRDEVAQFHSFMIKHPTVSTELQANPKFDELTGIAKKEMDEGRQLFKYVGNHVF